MSEFTSYGRQDLFETTLASAINSSTGSITVQDTVDFNLSSGTFYGMIDPEGTTPEAIQISGVSSTTWTVTRGIPLHEGGPSSAAEHAGGVRIIITNNWKTYSDIATAIASKINKAGGTFTGAVDFSGASTTLRIPNLTTVQRDALPSPSNGMVIYNTTDGEQQIYKGGAWTSVATGSTPNASTTVAGVVELATVAEQIAKTANGGSGAPLVPAVANMVTTSSGASDEGKIVLPGSTGQFAAGFIPPNTDTTKIPNSIVDAKGDLLVGFAADTPQVLPVGADGKALMADSTATNGLDWKWSYNVGNKGYGSFYTWPIDLTSLTAINTGNVSSGNFSASSSADTTNGATKALFTLLARNASVGGSLTQFVYEGGLYFDQNASLDVDGRIGLADAAATMVVAYNSTTGGFVGFALDGSANVLYAVTSSAGAITTTSVDASYTKEFKLFRIEYTTTSVLFYLGNSLVATHTTNIPTVTRAFHIGHGTFEVSATAISHGGILTQPVLSVLQNEWFA